MTANPQRGKRNNGRPSALEEWNAARNVLEADAILLKSWKALNSKIIEVGRSLSDDEASEDDAWYVGLHRVLQTTEGTRGASRYKVSKFSYLRRLYYELVGIAKDLIIKAMPSRLDHGLPDDLGVEQFVLGMVRRTNDAKSHKKAAYGNGNGAGKSDRVPAPGHDPGVQVEPRFF